MIHKVSLNKSKAKVNPPKKEKFSAIIIEEDYLSKHFSIKLDYILLILIV